MERRVLVAIILSFLVIYSYQVFFVTPPPDAASQTAGQTAGQSAGAAPGSPSAAPTATPEAAPAGPQATALVGETSERDIRVETENVSAVFTNRGARLKSWRLKKFQDRNREPLELVATELTATEPLPFTLRTSDESLNTTLNTALYSLRAPPSGATEPANTQLTFEYRDDSGVSVVKEFQLDPETYTIGFKATVAQNDRILVPTIVWGPGLGDHDSQTGRATVLPRGLYSIAGDVERPDSGDVLTQPLYEGDFDYAGIDDHYFTAVALKSGPSKIIYRHQTAPPQPGSTDTPREYMSFALEPARADQQTTFYVGPKEFDELAAIDRNLVKAIDFGIFSVLVVPLLRSLIWIQGYIGNYGWAIVALTILLNLVLFPLNHKSVVSMRKMQEIQPEAKAIQERYAKLKATDPAKQKMNQELMALYRSKGVNPASGCIPILLTLPVFLAFYNLLSYAIELRGAPFVGWVTDLSLPDPYYVLPVLVGLAQFLQTWMTPQPGADPVQQRMMLIMPLVLTFVFVTSPSGALLYWFVGSVWRIGQQWFTNYLIGPPKVHAAVGTGTAAERRVKRVGAGKSEGAAKES